MNFNKFIKISLVFLVIFAWIFSGYPQIWQNPPFPPEIEETRAASPEVFTVDGTFNPANGIYAVTVECWGGGGGGGSINNNGGGGGGGGAYVKSTGVAVVPGGAGHAVDIGAGGASEVGGADSTFDTTTVVADGGTAAVNNANGTGGTALNSTGNAIESAGGDGGDGYTTGDVGAGGGGAGGPDGGGLTANNASSNTATAGGNANNSVGTGTGGTPVDNGAGNPGNDDLTKGGGAGAGSENSNIGGAGGAPGGGGGGGGDNTAGGAGADGRCIISYTDTWAPSTAQATYSNTWSFSTAPNNDADGQITMAATTPGYDYNTISYSFTYTACASNQGTNGTNSGWQAGTSYSDIGLDPNKCYGYTVQTKDSLGNTGTASAASETYSSANIPGTPTLSGATATTLNLTNAENSNPSASPTTYFAVQVVTGDATWLNKWVNASGEPVASEVWLTDTQLDALVLGSGGTPLANSTTYGVKVKARNENTDETSLSTEGQGATTAPPNSAPTLSISQPDGVGDFVAIGSTFNITYTLDDTEDTVTANFAYDSDSSGLDGTLVTDCLNQPEGTNVTCAWDTTGMSAGDYYIYATTTDGTNPQVSDYSNGTTTLNIVSISLDTNGSITFDILPQGGNASTTDGGFGGVETISIDGGPADLVISSTVFSDGSNNWTLGANNGVNQVRWQFNTSTDWVTFASPGANYGLNQNVSHLGAQNVYFRLRMPSETNYFNPFSTTVTVTASAP